MFDNCFLLSNSIEELTSFWNHLQVYPVQRTVALQQKSYFKLLPGYTFLYTSWKPPPAVPNTRRNQFEFNLGFFFRASFCWLSVVFTLFDFCNFIHNKLDLGFEKPIGVDRGVWNNILFDKSRFGARKWWGPRNPTKSWIGFVNVKWRKLIIAHNELFGASYTMR